MTNSIYRRHFFLTASMILISFALLGSAFITLSYQYTIREKQDTLLENVTAVSSMAAKVQLNGMTIQNENFQTIMIALSQMSGSHVILTTPEGVVALAAEGSISFDLRGWQLPEAVVSETAVNGLYSGMTTLGGMYQESRFVVGRPILAMRSDGETMVLGLAFMATQASSFKIGRASCRERV